MLTEEIKREFNKATGSDATWDEVDAIVGRMRRVNRKRPDSVHLERLIDWYRGEKNNPAWNPENLEDLLSLVTTMVPGFVWACIRAHIDMKKEANQ